MKKKQKKKNRDNTQNVLLSKFLTWIWVFNTSVFKKRAKSWLGREEGG